eukprot:SAG22_NODE_8908_length_622_cov_1.068834_1_plen_75_part_10
MAMNPTTPEAREMVGRLLQEAAATAGAAAKYVHIGGDEVKFGAADWPAAPFRLWCRVWSCLTSLLSLHIAWPSDC